MWSTFLTTYLWFLDLKLSDFLNPYPEFGLEKSSKGKNNLFNILNPGEEL